MLLNTGDKPVASENGLLTTVGWQVGGKVDVLPGGLRLHRRGGGAVAARRPARSSPPPPTSRRSPRAVPDSDGVYLVPAFVGLGAPLLGPYARGTIIGLTRNTTMSHVARAALDSMAFQTRDVLEAMQRDAGVKLHTEGRRRAAANNLLLQFQADVLGVPVRRPSSRRRRRWARPTWPASPSATGRTPTTW
jgi:glycerol kinase